MAHILVVVSRINEVATGVSECVQQFEGRLLVHRVHERGPCRADTHSTELKGRDPGACVSSLATSSDTKIERTAHLTPALGLRILSRPNLVFGSGGGAKKSDMLRVEVRGCAV
jgi:hypothetical protein